MLPVGIRDFHELLDVLVPKRNGALVVIKGFFDASTRQKSGIFCVAGFAFRKLQLQKFERDWWNLFGKYGGCHMKELVHGIGRFADADRDSLIKAAVQILRKRSCFGIVVSCNLHEMNRLLPTWVRGFEHAYPVCCHMAMTALGSKISDSGSDDRVAYFFETGDEYSGCAHDFMNRYCQVPVCKKAYRHSSHAFVDKEDAMALQSADMLAWECAKYLDETVGQRVRPMRLSLAHMLLSRNAINYDDKKFKILHLTGESLKKWAEQVWQLGMEQRAEDAARKSSPSDESS